MCGFSGIISNYEEQRDISIIQEMQEIAAHRGPDGNGLYEKDNIALGHNRLKIIDLSEKGNQPLSRFNYTIVYNGEIYNYKELRSDFEQMGYVFKSDTDTEVILAAYQYYGTQCTHQFNGMWSFAIYDSKREEVFLSVDRFGIKPLYFLKHNEAFIFCSEIKQLKAIKGFSFIVNKKVASTFLATGVKNYSSNTFVKGVKRLMGGHNIMYDCTSEEYAIKKYYTPDLKELDIDFEEAKFEYKKRLEYSVDLRLRSDVELGLSISGGVDSSVIATIVKSKQDGVEHLTFNYNGQSSDDMILARKINTHLTSSDLAVAGLNSEEISKDFSYLVYAQEEPFSNFSIAAQYKLFKTSNELGLKVLIGGQGADEALGGYLPYFKVAFREGLRKGNFLNTFSNGIQAPLKQWKEFIGAFSSKGVNLLGGLEKEELPSFDGWDYFRNFSKEQIFFNSLPALLHYEDRNSMINSVESRLPFMDYRLMEFSLKLPTEFKINSGVRKYILREAFKDVLPVDIYRRHNKSAFDTPLVDGLMKNLEFFKKKINILTDRMPELVDKKGCDLIIERFTKRPSKGLGSQLVRLASMGEWVRRFDVF